MSVLIFVIIAVLSVTAVTPSPIDFMSGASRGKPDVYNPSEMKKAEALHMGDPMAEEVLETEAEEWIRADPQETGSKGLLRIKRHNVEDDEVDIFELFPYRPESSYTNLAYDRPGIYGGGWGTQYVHPVVIYRQKFSLRP